MTGLFDKVKKAFKGKEEEPFAPTRLHVQRVEEPAPPVDEAGSRWKEAKKWREEQQDKEPLVNRSKFKRRIQ